MFSITRRVRVIFAIVSAVASFGVIGTGEALAEGGLVITYGDVSSTYAGYDPIAAWYANSLVCDAWGSCYHVTAYAPPAYPHPAPHNYTQWTYPNSPSYWPYYYR